MKIQEVYGGKLKNIWEKAPLKNYVFPALGITLLTALFIVLFRSFLPPEVPLFYGNTVGEGQLVRIEYMFMAPLVSLLVLGLNIFLSTFVKDSFLKKVLIISAFFVSILISITVFKIIFLVGFF